VVVNSVSDRVNSVSDRVNSVSDRVNSVSYRVNSVSDRVNSVSDRVNDRVPFPVNPQLFANSDVVVNIALLLVRPFFSFEQMEHMLPASERNSLCESHLLSRNEAHAAAPASGAIRF
jgi:hypothetical protein